MKIKAYMCISVEGAIKAHRRYKPTDSSWVVQNGRELNNAEYLAHLTIEQAKGRKVIPLNGRCGNPCSNSEHCTGFDYSDEGGCPGYPTEK